MPRADRWKISQARFPAGADHSAARSLPFAALPGIGAVADMVGTTRLVAFCFDVFSSREPVSVPDQVRDKLSLESTIFLFTNCYAYQIR
jgi:hypothetical protein